MTVPAESFSGPVKGRHKFTASKGTFKARAANLPAETDFFGQGWMKAMSGFLDAVEQIGYDTQDIFLVLVGRLFERIQIRTPFDTGHARSGWNMSSKPSRQGGVQVLIWNLVPYIVFLEFGWSNFAPKGMVRISLEEMRKELRTGMAGLLQGGGAA